MKRPIKLILLLLALLMLPTTATAYDFEVNGIYYNLIGDNQVEVTNQRYDPYYGEEPIPSYTGHMTLPETVTYGGTIYSVTSIGNAAFLGCSSLISINIPNSVTSIGNSAFDGCSSLNSINIPNSVTSIGYSTFYGCSSLISINIPNSVTSIGNHAFDGCSSLISINIPNSVTSIGEGVFWGCSGLTSVIIGNSVTFIGDAVFCECRSLTSVDIPNSVTSIGNSAFYGCSSLISINIPNSVTSIGDAAFYGCSSLISINIGNSVTSIGNYAFYGCSGLTSVTIPNSVTSIGNYAFHGCSGLTSVIIPNSVTSIGDYAFDGCSSLISVDIPNSVTSIGIFAFHGCSGLTSVTIPNSVTSIGNYAFRYCSGLTSIIVESGNPNYDSRDNCNAIIETGSNTLITGCKNTVIPNSVTSIGDYAFAGCSSLISVDIPNSVTSIGEGVFWGCSGLTSVIIPISVTSIGNHAFDGCSGLTSVIIPNSVTSIGNYAFYGCRSLTSVDIPNSVTSIGEGAFWNCSGLTSVTIPNSVTSIGDHAFCECRSLTSVSIPTSVTSIGEEAFYHNKISTLIILGEGEWQAGAISISEPLSSSLTLVVDSSISGLNGISINPSRGVYCYAATPPSCDINTFKDYSGTLHVTATSIAAYFTADYWCNFANIVGDAVEPTKVTISNDSIEMRIGDEAILTASVVPANATPNTITWISTNPDIANVNNGRVSAIGVGECDIIAQCLNLRTICHVVVNDTTVTISLGRHEARMRPNHIITLTPSASPSMPDLVVTSSDPTVASARLANGKVQVVGIKEGKTTITVGSVDGKAVPDTCLVTVYTELGDVNCDGYVNISDVTGLIDYLLSGDFDNVSQTNADCDKDGNVNIADVTSLIDYLLGGIDLNPPVIETFTVNGVSFTMVEVKGGTYTMGATAEQGSDAYDWEYPTHQVTLSGYCIGQTEVTQAMWQAVMGSNPSYFTGDLQRPVECVTWNDCQTFITRLNELTGKTFRLPSEAEWEYAARSGNRSQCYKYAGSNTIDDVAWYESNSSSTTHPVATKAPNELGLYDMSGNVWEWCQDWYGNYSSGAQTDPTGPASGSRRVYRGGCCGNGAESCRVSSRYGCNPTDTGNGLGLRLAL